MNAEVHPFPRRPDASGGAKTVADLMRAEAVRAIRSLASPRHAVIWGRRPQFVGDDDVFGSWGPIWRAFFAAGVELVDYDQSKIETYTAFPNLFAHQFHALCAGNAPLPGDVAIYEFPYRGLNDARVTTYQPMLITGERTPHDGDPRPTIAGAYPCTSVTEIDESPWWAKRRLAVFRLSDRAPEKRAA